MQRIEVYVRARTPKGRWVSANALDLNEDSFRRLLLRKMVEAGMLVGVRVPDVEEPIYETRDEVEED